MDYTLHVKIDGISSLKEDENKKELEKATTPTKKSDSDNEDVKSINKSVSAMAGAMLLKEGVAVTKKIVRNNISQIGARQDNIARQNEIENMMSVGEEVVSGVTSVASATIMGAAVGGPVGAAVGAVVSVAALAINKAIEINNNLESYKRQQLEYSLQATKSTERLGNICTKRNR